MWVKKSKPFTILDILNGHVFKHGGLTHSGFTNGIKMPDSVLGFNTKSNPFIAGIGFGKIGYSIFIVWGHGSNGLNF